MKQRLERKTENNRMAAIDETLKFNGGGWHR